MLHHVNTVFQDSPQMIANAILDADSGRILEFRQLIHHKNTNFKKSG